MTNSWRLTEIQRGNVGPFSGDRIEDVAFFHSVLAVPSTDAVNFTAQIAHSYRFRFRKEWSRLPRADWQLTDAIDSYRCWNEPTWAEAVWSICRFRCCRPRPWPVPSFRYIHRLRRLCHRWRWCRTGREPPASAPTASTGSTTDRTFRLCASTRLDRTRLRSNHNRIEAWT